MTQFAKIVCGVLVGLGVLGVSPSLAQASDAYYLVSRLDGKVLDVQGAVCADGAPIIQWPLNGGANQQWRLEPTGDGYVRIVSRLDDKVLDVSGGVCDDGAPIVQWPWHGGANQEWCLVRAK
jgi:alpha-glucosidase